jgi:hypothetical protein
MSLGPGSASRLVKELHLGKGGAGHSLQSATSPSEEEEPSEGQEQPQTESLGRPSMELHGTFMEWLIHHFSYLY